MAFRYCLAEAVGGAVDLNADSRARCGRLFLSPRGVHRWLRLLAQRPVLGIGNHAHHFAGHCPRRSPIADRKGTPERLLPSKVLLDEGFVDEKDSRSPESIPGRDVPTREDGSAHHAEVVGGHAVVESGAAFFRPVISGNSDAIVPGAAADWGHDRDGGGRHARSGGDGLSQALEHHRSVLVAQPGAPQIDRGDQHPVLLESQFLGGQVHERTNEERGAEH